MNGEDISFKPWTGEAMMQRCADKMPNRLAKTCFDVGTLIYWTWKTDG